MEWSKMGDVLKGSVKWFNDAKGFGFIEHTSGKDVFVHYSVIESEGFKTLKDGEQVEYELKQGEKGLHAARVVRVNPPPAATKKEEPLSSLIEVEREAPADSAGAFSAPGQIETDSDKSTL